MGELPHAFIGRLEAAEEIIEVSLLEIARRIQEMRWFEGLPFFNFNPIPIEKLSNHQ